MKINYNMSAYLAAQSLNKNETALEKATERLSTGYKINHAKDNPSGIAISRKMRLQIKGLELASDNASDGVNVVETAEGALNEVQDMLTRINELSIKASNGVLSDSDRANVEMEVQKLKEEIDRISETTEFNGINLLDGSVGVKGYTNSVGVDVLDYNDKCRAGYYKFTFYVGKVMEYNDDIADYEFSGAYEIMEAGLDVNNPNDFEVKLNDEASFTHPKTNEEIEYKTINNPVYSVSHYKDTLQITGDNEFDLSLSMDWDRLFSNNSEITGQTPDTKDITVVEKDEFDAPVIDEETKTTKTKEVRYEVYKVETRVELKGYGGMVIQIGAEEGQELNMNLSAVNTKTLQIDKLSVATYEDSCRAIKASSDAINMLSLHRARLGAYENRLEHAINSLDATEENMTKAYSTITDTDMAEEMTKYTNYQVLVQAGTSMVSQANERPSQVLQLLQ